mgnify:FL=1
MRLEDAQKAEQCFYTTYGIPLEVVGCRHAHESDVEAWYAALLAVGSQAHDALGCLLAPLSSSAYHGYLLLVREVGTSYPLHVIFALS